MKRKIIQIDESRCNGCGICVNACHEGAIALIDGKAHLMRDDYCDGLGDCLPACPQDAITFTEREAKAYDADAVAKAKAVKAVFAANMHEAQGAAPQGCPSARQRTFERSDGGPKTSAAHDLSDPDTGSELTQWPVQIQLLPPKAAFYDGADLLIAADCTAFSCGDFHERFVKGKVVLVGCPKLDPVDYSDKLTDILSNNDVASITVVRMEVPCCGGITYAVQRALEASGKDLPVSTTILSTDGRIIA